MFLPGVVENKEELERHGDEGTQVVPEGDEQSTIDSIQDVHGHFDKPLSRPDWDPDCMGSRARLFDYRVVFSHVVDPISGIVMLPFVLVFDMCPVVCRVRCRCLDVQEALVVVRIFDYLFGQLSALNIFSEEVCIEISDDFEGQEVLHDF